MRLRKFTKSMMGHSIINLLMIIINIFAQVQKKDMENLWRKAILNKLINTSSNVYINFYKSMDYWS